MGERHFGKLKMQFWMVGGLMSFVSFGSSLPLSFPQNISSLFLHFVCKGGSALDM